MKNLLGGGRRSSLLLALAGWVTIMAGAPGKAVGFIHAGVCTATDRQALVPGTGYADEREVISRARFGQPARAGRTPPPLKLSRAGQSEAPLPASTKETADGLLDVLRRAAERLRLPARSRALKPEWEHTALLATYNLFLLDDKPAEAHQALARAFHLNDGLDNPALKRRNYLEMALLDKVDFYRDDIIDGLGLNRLPTPDTRGKRVNDAQPSLGNPDEILSKLAVYVNSLTDRDEFMSPRALSLDLISLRRDLSKSLPLPAAVDDDKLFALAEAVNLWLFYERTYLHMHNILVVGKVPRFSDQESDFADAEPYTKVFHALTAYGRRDVLLLSLSRVERIVFNPNGEGNPEEAKALIQFVISLLGSDPQPFPRRAYLAAKSLLLLAPLAARDRDLPAMQLIIQKASTIIPKIAAPADRDEMSGFYFRYRAQLEALADAVEPSLADFRKSLEGLNRIDSQHALEVYGEMAQVLIRRGNYREALDEEKNIAALREKLRGKFSEAEINRRLTAFAVAVVQAYFFSEDYAGVRAAVARNAPVLNLNADANSLAQLYLGLSILAETKDDCAKALPAFEAGLSFIPDLEVSGGSLSLNFEAGRCHERLGQSEAALPLLEKALIIDRNMRKSSRSSVAYTAIYANGRTPEIEQVMSAVIFDLMQKPGADSQELTKKLLFYGEMEKSRGLYDELEVALYGLMSGGAGGSAAELMQRREYLQQLNIPFYSDLDVGSIDTSDIFERYKSFLGKLAKKEGSPVVLVEYLPIERKDRLAIFVLDDQKTATMILSTPWSMIVERVRQLRSQLADSLHLYERARRTPVPSAQVVQQIQRLEEMIAASSAELGTMLFPVNMPGVGNLGQYIKKKRLVVVPHGPLHNLPFAALKLENGGQTDYLIDTVSRYASMPSSSLLFLLANRQELTGRENINSILIVGSTDDPTLPKVGEEFENISRAVKSSKRVSSKAEVQQAVSEVAALHFGSHAYFDREHPVSSGLSLKDGLLTLGEITGLRRFRPRVVTMGACESGEANVSMGDEVWSLQTAFMFSGASAVIGSLWQQDGDAAQIFYSTFYREVVPGGDVGAAFYNAMQEARHRRQSAVGEGIPRLMNSDNPCFWAGFNLIGQ